MYNKFSGYPGVYARVSEAYDWIREEVCRQSNNNSSADLTPEYFDCPKISTEAKAMTVSPTIHPTTTRPPSMTPSIRETSATPTINSLTGSPSSDAPTLEISNDPQQYQYISSTSTNAPTIPRETQFPTPVPTAKHPTDTPSSYSTDAGKTVFIESATVAPTMLTYVPVPLLEVEEPL